MYSEPATDILPLAERSQGNSQAAGSTQMLKRIDIANFGCFTEFLWNTVRDEGNNIADFKKLNFIYGRNYSGKTTLSRVARCLETGRLPPNFAAPQFAVRTSTGEVTQVQLPSADHALRVYNRDFIDDHLSILRNSAGNVTPFAVLGSENREIAAQIEARELQLGSAETQRGLRHDLEQSRVTGADAAMALSREENTLQAALSRKALSEEAGIKHKTSLYKDPNYNVPKLKADVASVHASSMVPLDTKVRAELETLCAERALPGIAKLDQFDDKWIAIAGTANTLLTRHIRPTAALQDLLADATLQSWVKEGIGHHRNRRTTCGFCRSDLPPGLWQKLDAHFNQESQALSSDLTACIVAIEAERTAAQAIKRIAKIAVYASLQPELEAHDDALTAAIAAYVDNLGALAASLRARERDIFTNQPPIVVLDNMEPIRVAITAINKVVDASTGKTTTLEVEQREALQTLRLSEVAEFMAEVSLDTLETNVEAATAVSNTRRAEYRALETRIREAENEIAELRTQLKDERLGAEAVNRYLGNHFGHASLRLDAVEDPQTAIYTFRIRRGNADAYNLSEGECSLVAFCYFLAKLDDTESQGKKLIVWIDDPISSLDGNHIFFAFSLLESRLAAPIVGADGKLVLDVAGKKTYRYEQLFIATHNLEFLKYLKRLSAPKNDHAHFVVLSGTGGSVVHVMPKYLREYITEFNFLFGEICVCATPENEATFHNSFYNFGNNLRKFLEAYLFFKYPFTKEGSENDYKTRVERFFANGVGAEGLVNRITHEYSHLAGLDRAAEPIDRNEISRVAQFVLAALRSADGDQYRDLLASVGKADPLPA
jgi:wobble nucleotide-excising tRNase